ncbi:MAG: hypothetical protein RL408_801 [Bacteroidota bacterium]|jgi:hypothetical protein
MANTAIKLLIILLMISSSIKTVAQENPKNEFLFNGCGQSEFYEYFSHNLKVWGNRPTFNLFVFKLNGNGKITDLRHMGGMEKTDAEHVMKFIKQSETCWNLPSDPKLFKWIILPFISGKGNANSQKEPDFKSTTMDAFSKLRSLTSFGIYSGEFYITDLVWYIDPRIKLD